MILSRVSLEFLSAVDAYLIRQRLQSRDTSSLNGQIPRLKEKYDLPYDATDEELKGILTTSLKSFYNLKESDDEKDLCKAHLNALARGLYRLDRHAPDDDLVFAARLFYELHNGKKIPSIEERGEDLSLIAIQVALQRKFDSSPELFEVATLALEERFIRDTSRALFHAIQASKEDNASKDDSIVSYLQKLISLLGSPINETRFNVVCSLGDLKHPKVVSKLIESLDTEDDVLCRCIASALGLIGDEAGVEPLIELLVDENDLVCVHAACALGKIKDQRAIEPLKECMHDENDEVSQAAAHALANIGGEEIVDFFISLASREDIGVISNFALEALAIQGNKKAIDYLTGLLKKEDKALSELVVKAIVTAENEEASMLIENLLNERDDLRDLVIRKLIEESDQKCYAILINFLNKQDDVMMSKLLHENKALLRFYSTYACLKFEKEKDSRPLDVLTEFLNAQKEEYLINLLEDEHPPVRFLTIHALGNVGGQAAYDAILSHAEDRVDIINAAFFTLGKIEERRKIEGRLEVQE